MIVAKPSDFNAFFSGQSFACCFAGLKRAMLNVHVSSQVAYSSSFLHSLSGATCQPETVFERSDWKASDGEVEVGNGV